MILANLNLPVATLQIKGFCIQTAVQSLSSTAPNTLTNNRAQSVNHTRVIHTADQKITNRPCLLDHAKGNLLEITEPVCKSSNAKAPRPRSFQAAVTSFLFGAPHHARLQLMLKNLAHQCCKLKSGHVFIRILSKISCVNQSRCSGRRAEHVGARVSNSFARFNQLVCHLLNSTPGSSAKQCQGLAGMLMSPMAGRPTEALLMKLSDIMAIQKSHRKMENR